MKRGIVGAISVVVAFILHTTVFRFFALAGIVPNVTLILVCSVAIIRGQKEGMIIGFFSGLMLDIFTNSILGPYAFLFMVIGFIDGLFHTDYYSDGAFMPMIVLSITDLCYGIIMYVASMLLHNHLNIGYYLIHTILPEVIYTAAIGFILYKILVRISDRLDMSENYKRDKL